MRAVLDAGIDLGGTRIKYGLIDRTGRVVHRDSLATPGTMPELLACLEGIWRLLKTKGRVRSCGFGIPGFYSLKDRMILQSPNYPGLDGYPIVPAFRRFIDVPFRIGNDANMAAYGEYRHGAGRGAQSLVFLTVGTGIGSGLILDGTLWEGKCGFAGELGHITVNPEGERCNCGSRGCLETEASAPKIVKHYLALTGRRKPLTSREVYLLAKSGDRNALRSFTRCGTYLGIGLGIIINFLNPELILIGGGVVSAGRYLLGPAVAEARRRAHRVSFACGRIGRASLGNDAGLIGAAAWAREGAGTGGPC